jgi:hypothetical protein
MSNKAIKAAFETKLSSLQPPLPTAFENTNYKPVDGQPYQECWLLFAAPENPTFGDNFYRQRGYMQVDLRYPTNQGGGPAGDRAEFIRDSFPRGLSLIAAGVTSVVENTPEISNGVVEGDRYVIRVRVRFYANVMKG